MSRTKLSLVGLSAAAALFSARYELNKSDEVLGVDSVAGGATKPVAGSYVEPLAPASEVLIPFVSPVKSVPGVGVGRFMLAVSRAESDVMVFSRPLPLGLLLPPTAEPLST